MSRISKYPQAVWFCTKRTGGVDRKLVPEADGGEKGGQINERKTVAKEKGTWHFPRGGILICTHLTHTRLNSVLYTFRWGLVARSMRKLLPDLRLLLGRAGLKARPLAFTGPWAPGEYYTSEMCAGRAWEAEWINKCVARRFSDCLELWRPGLPRRRWRAAAEFLSWSFSLILVFSLEGYLPPS